MAGPPMLGFQEHGEPESWDMAVGTVQGYRWWYMYLYFTSRGNTYDRYTGASLRMYGELSDYWRVSMWTPNFGRSSVCGMHGGTWNKGYKQGGWYKGRCEKNFSGVSPTFRPPPHPVPDPDCGCGFWAYWDSYSHDSSRFNCVPWVKYDGDYGYTVQIPMMGRVEGAGRTIIGEKGFRAERVRITDLSLDSFSPTIFEEEKLQFAYNHVTDLGNLAGTLPYHQTGPVMTQTPASSFLSQRFQIPSNDIEEAFRHAADLAVGEGHIRWHNSPYLLAVNTQPDERYGKR